MKILIVEDDKKLNEGIKLALKSDELEFVQAFNLKEAKEEIKTRDDNRTTDEVPSGLPDLIVLDINLPDGNGLDWLKYIRTQKLPIRVIMITANNMETDIVTGLELGADDYITKPFSLMVLRARVNVQIRNIESQVGNRDAGAGTTKAIMGINDDGKIKIDHFSFDFNKMQFDVSGYLIELSKTEQRLLRSLLENRGRVITREKLIDRVWSGETEYVDEHALTVSIKRLRDKLEKDSSNPIYIKTVYGIGYTWAVS